MRRIWQAHLALFTVNMIYGANYLVAKGLMPDLLRPSAFILIRVLGATLLFSLLRNFVRERVAWIDLGRMAICGLFGVATNQLLFFHGLDLTSPINASIIMTCTPIIVLILSAILIEERVTKKKLFGVILGAMGAILLVLSSRSAVGHASFKGDLFVLMNATSYSIYLVLVKPLMSKYSPITVISWVFLFGLIYVLPIGMSDLVAVDLDAFSTRHVMAVVFVVLGTTFLAYLLNIFALRSLNPSVVSSYIYLQPVMAGFFAWVYMKFGMALLGTTTDYTAAIDLQKVLCALAIFAGVYLVSSADRPASA